MGRPWPSDERESKDQSVGLAKPINNRRYDLFQVKGMELYIERKLVDALPGFGGMINVLMGDYGCWTISLQNAAAV